VESHSKGGFYPSRDSHIELNNVCSLDFHKLAVPVAYQKYSSQFSLYLSKGVTLYFPPSKGFSKSQRRRHLFFASNEVPSNTVSS